jgi:transcriptional regulator with XRE-family HTH domain
MSEAFGTEIKTRRTAIGMSQARLAELVGRSTSTVRSWERGRTEPSPDALDALTAVLGLDSYDDETVIEIPVVVAGVAPESFKESDVLDDEKSSVAEEAVPAPRKETNGGVAMASVMATEDSFPVAAQAPVDDTVIQTLASTPAPVVEAPEATVSFIDEPTWTVRYVVRTVATVGVLLGLAIVGRWAASGALEVFKAVLSAVKTALGF